LLKKLKSRKKKIIVGNIISQILSHLTQNHANSTEFQPSDGPSNQLYWTTYRTAQKSASPNKKTPTASLCQTQEPSLSQKEKKIINQIQNRNKSNKTNQALRYIPPKAETNLPCVGSRFTL
jgi:hypothetical protein